MAASSEDPFLCMLMSSLLLLFLWFIFVFLYIWKMLFGLRDWGIGALELPCYNGVETGGHYVWRWWYRWLLCRPRCLSPSLLMWQQLRRLRDLLLARLLWRSQLVTTARLWLLRLQPRSNSPKLQRNLGLVKEVLVESTPKAETRFVDPPAKAGAATHTSDEISPCGHGRTLHLGRFLRLQPRRSSRKYQRNLRHVRKCYAVCADYSSRTAKQLHAWLGQFWLP